MLIGFHLALTFRIIGSYLMHEPTNPRDFRTYIETLHSYPEGLNFTFELLATVSTPSLYNYIFHVVDKFNQLSKRYFDSVVVT